MRLQAKSTGHLEINSSPIRFAFPMQIFHKHAINGLEIILREKREVLFGKT